MLIAISIRNALVKAPSLLVENAEEMVLLYPAREVVSRRQRRVQRGVINLEGHP